MTEVGSITFVPPERMVLEEAIGKAFFACKEQVLTDCNYYCRQWQGTLISSSNAAANNQELILTWNTPYARRVYYTGTPSKQVNPNASLQWCEKAADTFGNDWAVIIMKGLAANL